MAESRGRQYRKTWRWIQLAQHIKATGPNVCTYPDCDNPAGRKIDTTLPARHRWSHTVDHKTELEDGGEPFDEANLTELHWRCNSRKARANQKRRAQDAFRVKSRARELNPSRAW